MITKKTLDDYRKSENKCYDKIRMLMDKKTETSSSYVLDKERLDSEIKEKQKECNQIKAIRKKLEEEYQQNEIRNSQQKNQANIKQNIKENSLFKKLANYNSFLLRTTLTIFLVIFFAFILISVFTKDLVIDNSIVITGEQKKLMWMRCTIGQTWQNNTCIGDATRFTWDDAMKLSVSFASYSDWRLPTIQELESLIYCSNNIQYNFNETDSGCGGNPNQNHQSPTINLEKFPNTPAAGVWSRTLSTNNIYKAWYVGFNSGYAIDDKTNNLFYVRLVRDIQ